MLIRAIPVYMCLPLLFGAQAAAHADEVLRFKVLVTLKSRIAEAPKPFPNVGGFTIKRLTADMPGAKCPDASDDKGELECVISCSASDPNPRLTIFTPTKERQRIIAGYGIEPSSASIQLGACKFVGDAKITFTYKSWNVLLAELKQRSPNVYAAITTGSAGDQNAVFKPLADNAQVLTAMAMTPDNRAGLIALANLADVRRESLPAGEKEADALAAYAVGARSAMFRAAVLGTEWSDAENMAAVTHDPLVFSRNVSTAAKKLNQKATLNAKEISLDKDIRMMRAK